MSKRHVLISGASGFIGSHLTERFLDAGYAVTGVDNFVTGSRQNLDIARKSPDFHFLEWDICKPLPEERLPLLSKFGLHGMLHFACPASPVDFDRIPLEILDVDSIGTRLTVDLAWKYGARYMLASTSEIYGDPLVHPQTEDYWGNVNTLGPRACYDEAKRFGEAVVSTAMRGVGTGKPKLDGRIVRIFNTYGPRMRPDDGRVVPELIMQALAGRDLTIHGNGQQTRSFCFVSDLVDGIFKLFESSCILPVNIGNPSERTILDFAQATLRLTGSTSKISHLPGREDDPRRRCPDITRANRELNWQPKVDLDEGLKKTIEFFRQGSR